MSAMAKIHNAWSIFYSICGEWLGLMSGAFSVFSTFAAFYYEGHQRRLFVFLAFGALWICVIRLACKNFPRFILSCNRDIAGCIVPNPDGTWRVYRLLVQTCCVRSITECVGQLERIEKNGEVVYDHEARQLPIAPSESDSALSKTIYQETRNFLDVLAVNFPKPRERSEEEIRIWAANPTPYKPQTPRGIVYIAGIKGSVHTVNDKNGNRVFETDGEYILYVNVSGKDVPTSKAVLKFIWTGNPDTSTIRRIK